MPTRIAKVFVKGDEQKRITSEYQVVEPYQAFVLIKATDKQLKKIARDYPVQDISDDYEVHTPSGTMAPAVAVTAGKGKGRATVSKKRLPSGPHHYLLQFIGPI